MKKKKIKHGVLFPNNAKKLFTFSNAVHNKTLCNFLLPKFLSALILLEKPK